MYCLWAICLSFEEVVDVLVYVLHIPPSTKIVHLRTTPLYIVATSLRKLRQKYFLSRARADSL